MADKGWIPKLRTKSGAEAWGYFSRSGKTLKIYVRPLDDIGDPILFSPVIVTLPLSKLLKRRVCRG